MKIAVLISGNGSNLESIIQACLGNQLSSSVKLVISNNSQAYGIKRAEQHNIPNLCIPHQDRQHREDFDDEINRALQDYAIDFVVLAGFMRVLTSQFCKTWQKRLINIHPSLLPLYPGLNTHQRVLDDDRKWHGATVHYATEDLDAGAIIIQAKTQVKNNDTADSLQERVHTLEHIIYPKAIQLIEQNHVELRDDGMIYHLGKKLEQPLMHNLGTG